MVAVSYAMLALVVYASFLGLARPGVVAAFGISVFAVEQVIIAGNSTFALNPSWWNFITGALLVVSLASLILRGRYRFHGGVRVTLTAALLCVAYFCWGWTWGPFGGPPEGAIGSVVAYVVSQVILVPLLLQEQNDARTAFQWLAVIAGVVSVAALATYFSVEKVQRLRLTWGEDATNLSNPAVFADAVACAFIVLAFYSGSGVAGALRWPFMLITLTIAGLASRGEAITGLVAVVATLVVIPGVRRAREWVTITLALVVGVLAMSFVLETPVATRYEPDRIELDAGLRVKGAQAMLDAYFDSPESWLMGLGTDQSAALVGFYPHVQIVQALTEGGIVGLGLWLTVHLSAFWSAWRYRPFVDNDAKRFVLRCATACWVYFFLLGMKRGHVLDVWALSSAVLLQRCVIILSEGKAVDGPDELTGGSVVAKSRVVAA
jgi:hypothetical protein